MELENVPISEVKRGKGNKWRNKNDTTENDFKDDRHLADSDSVKIRATEMESASERQTSICSINESRMEQPIAEVNSSLGKTQQKKQKKRKARYDALDNKSDNNLHVANGKHSEKEQEDSFLQPPVNTCSKNESEDIAEARLSTKRRKDKKSKHKALGSNLDCGLTMAEGKHSETQDFKSVLEVAESNLENLKACKVDNNGAGTLSVEKDLKTCSREQIDETNEKMKTRQRKRRNSADELENNLKQFEVDGTRQFPDDAQIPSLLENEIKRIRVGDQVLSMECLELEEASANYFGGALLHEESNERNQDASLKVTTCENEKDVNLQGTTEDNFEKKNRANGDKIEMTVHGACHINKSACHFHEKMCDNLSDYDKCKLLEVKDVEKEIKMDENGPTFHHVGACKDLEDASNKENMPKMLQPSSDSDYLGSTKKKLLILDLNGLLVDIVPSDSCLFEADIIVSGKSVFKRPFCDEFLQFCFKRFNVGVWSSRLKKNVNRVVNFLMGGDRRKLLFLWDQSYCTTTRFTTVERRGKPLLLKELKKLWGNVVPIVDYNESNTLLLDDSPYKALRNPAHTAIFPHPYDFKNAEDCSLGPGGDIRVYLEGLAAAENVQTYVQQNPFGQRPITESNPSWRFYCKVINDEPC